MGQSITMFISKPETNTDNFTENTNVVTDAAKGIL